MKMILMTRPTRGTRRSLMGLNSWERIKTIRLELAAWFTIRKLRKNLAILTTLTLIKIHQRTEIGPLPSLLGSSSPTTRRINLKTLEITEMLPNCKNLKVSLHLVKIKSHFNIPIKKLIISNFKKMGLTEIKMLKFWMWIILIMELKMVLIRRRLIITVNESGLNKKRPERTSLRLLRSFKGRS